MEKNICSGHRPEIGKTMAVLFPAIKILEWKPSSSKLFYLTAKTSTQAIAEKALDNLRQKGLRNEECNSNRQREDLFKPKVLCDPVYCEFAREYYNRVKTAIRDIFQQDDFTRNRIEEIC